LSLISWKEPGVLEETHDNELIIERVAALDIGKAEVVCCVRVPGEHGRGRRQEVATYSTMTRSLSVMAERLLELGVTRVVMEATSDYWKPPFYLLEAYGFEPWLVNAKDVKHLPGRPKTDKLDAVWLCKVAERQMIRPSFVPPPPIRRLRDLTRYRIDLVGTCTAEKQRVEKLLEDAQIKLSVVASDIFGVSGRDMMAALVAGERDPKALAGLARRRLKNKASQLEEAFTGHFTDHHAFLLAKMQVEQRQPRRGLGAQVPGGEFRLDGVLAGQQPVHRGVHLVGAGLAHAEVGTQGGVGPVAQGGQLGGRVQHPGHDQSHRQVPAAAGRAQQRREAEGLGLCPDGGGGAVRQGPGDRHGARLPGGDQLGAGQDRLDGGDGRGGQGGEVGDLFVFDLAVLAVGAAQVHRLVLVPLPGLVHVAGPDPGHVHRACPARHSQHGNGELRGCDSDTPFILATFLDQKSPNSLLRKGISPKPVVTSA
jgi:Transposase